MATIKSYTDLEQSKKLAEILPFESADMYYINGSVGKISIGEWGNNVHDEDDIPCWSLAVLISVLPRFIEFKGDKYYLRFMKEYVEYANDEISITGRCLHTTGNDNLVDACYEMIIRLNELNLL
jgi:hypothetical protein